jgi:hypothetical protein
MDFGTFGIQIEKLVSNGHWYIWDINREAGLRWILGHIGYNREDCFKRTLRHLG